MPRLIALLIACSLLLYPAHAQTVIPCDDAAFLAALTTANTNAQPDTLQLASHCTYTLPGTFTITSPDTLSIQGDNTTLTSNATLTTLFNLTTGADATFSGVNFSPFGITVQANATLHIVNSTFDGNGERVYALQNLGTTTVDNTELTGYTFRSGIENLGTMTLNTITCMDNDAFSGSCIDNRQQLTINGGLFQDNTAQSNGGAIKNSGTLTIQGANFADNSTQAHGGAIYTFANTGQLTVSNTTFRGNAADEYGGAIANDGHSVQINAVYFDDNEAERGGAVAAWRSASALRDANTQITNSTFTANTATESGGALYLDDDSRVSQSTFTTNTAFTGGAIGIYGRSNLIHNTLVSNHATQQGGGIYLNTSTIIPFSNNIVSQNTAGDFYPNIAGSSMDNGGYNLIGDPTGSQFNGAALTTDIVNAPANIAPLGDYGGATPTMYPLNDSLALDAGRCIGMTTDQRGSGFARIIDLSMYPNSGNGCDIGAVEAQTLPGIACLDGNEAPNILICAENLPNAGNDANFNGNGGNDTMTLNPGIAITDMDGGTGNDTLTISGQITGTAHGGSGSDTFMVQDGAAGFHAAGDSGSDHLIFDFTAASLTEIQAMIQAKNRGDTLVYRGQTFTWETMETVNIRTRFSISEQALQAALTAELPQSPLDFVLIDLQAGGAFVTARMPDGTTGTMRLHINVDNGLLVITYDDIQVSSGDVNAFTAISHQTVPGMFLNALDALNVAIVGVDDLQIITFTIDPLGIALTVQN